MYSYTPDYIYQNLRNYRIQLLGIKHGSMLSPDPWRASTKPSTSNGSACGLRSLRQQENQKFDMDQSSRDEGPVPSHAQRQALRFFGNAIISRL
jgi:hypothetical protein